MSNRKAGNYKLVQKLLDEDDQHERDGGHHATDEEAEAKAKTIAAAGKGCGIAANGIDAEGKVIPKKRKFVKEKLRIVASYEDLEVHDDMIRLSDLQKYTDISTIPVHNGFVKRDEMIAKVAENYDNEKGMSDLKNALLGMCVVLMNHSKVKEDEEEDVDRPLQKKAEDKKTTPPPKGTTLEKPFGINPHVGMMNYYLPQGYRVGREEQFEEFVDANILNTPEAYETFLKNIHLIIALHFARLEKLKAEREAAEKQAKKDARKAKREAAKAAPVAKVVTPEIKEVPTEPAKLAADEPIRVSKAKSKALKLAKLTKAGSGIGVTVQRS
jgi:hypothetical protein